VGLRATAEYSASEHPSLWRVSLWLTWSGRARPSVSRAKRGAPWRPDAVMVGLRPPRSSTPRPPACGGSASGWPYLAKVYVAVTKVVSGTLTLPASIERQWACGPARSTTPRPPRRPQNAPRAPRAPIQHL